ncbi:hypothetical protein [Streptomyces variegatus]|uniref:hypothetical protein n=1 Tax=Streptomyces variegatus TaxID=284040 RepID=UPI003C2FE06B
MTARDEEAVRASTAPVDTVRVTPLVDGVPDHGAAVVWSFHDPAVLALVEVHRYPPIGAAGPLRSPERTRVLAGLLTSDGFRCTEPMTLIDRLLHDRHTTGAAVETWGQTSASRHPTPGRPLYWWVLLPLVVRCPYGAGDWPLEEPGNITVHTAADVRPNPRYTDPAPRPYPGPPRPVDEGTYLRQAATRVPPPPAPYRL